MVGGKLVERLEALVYLGSELDWRGGAQEGSGGCCGLRETEGIVVSFECDPGDEVVDV